MFQISLILTAQFEWSVRGLVCCCQHGTRCSILYLFPRPMHFSHIKTVYVRPCQRVMDCIVLFSKEEKGGGWWKEGRKRRRERRSERRRKRSGAVQQWRTWQLSAGQKDCAEHLLLSPTPLQPPHYLSIYHKAARSNVCSSQDSHREGVGEWGKEGRIARKERREREKDRLHVWESWKWWGSKWSSCVCISKICW